VAPSFTDFYVQDVITCAKAITSEALAPIFLTSSVTGQGLELLRLFINLAPQRHQWAARLEEPVEFIIDETFGVPGVGTVVAGTVKRGVLSVNSPVLLGPDVRDGSFWKAAIKSIHYKRLPVSEAVAGQTAALALKKA
jgi:GTPase